MSHSPDRRWVALGLLAAPALVGHAEAQSRPPVPDAPTPIVVRSFPITNFSPLASATTTFGQLAFLGGLELQSDYRGFGGFSGMRIDPTGRLLTAISDQGQWLTAQLDLDRGRPAGLSQSKMAAILGPGGRPLAATGDWDCEGLWIEGGTAFVSTERSHRIFRFDTFGREGVMARGTIIPWNFGAQRPPFNRGVEAIGVMPRPSPHAGQVIAITERALDTAGNIRAFLIDGATTRTFFVRRTNDFDVTDLAFLPNGDMLLLERWFSAWRGVGMRIRRIDIATIRPSATIDGPIIVSADLGQQIDNMECLSVHHSGSETILTLMSDNNFSFLQRTLLLRFALQA